MIRNMMMFTSAMAFALPMALSQPATARPLTAPAQPAEWCWGDCDSDGDGDGGGDVDIDIDIKVCVEVKFEQDDRANFGECEVLKGRECVARCTPEAVATSCELDFAASGLTPRSLASCVDERMDTCREQCYSGGAGFCEVRGGGGDWKPPGKGLGHCKHDEWKPGAQGVGHDYFDPPNNPWCNMGNRPKPKRPDHDHDHDHDGDHDGDHDHDGDNDGDNDGFVFIDIDICVDLEVKVDSD